MTDPNQTRAAAGRRRGTVAVVDDSDSCAATLEIALQGVVALAFYRRAEEALARIEADAEGSFRALITDLHLPGMDGFELVRRVRRLKPPGSFPILVVSGDSDPETPGRVLGLGADAVFHKPYSPSELRQTLEKLLDEKHNSRPLA